MKCVFGTKGRDWRPRLHPRGSGAEAIFLFSSSMQVVMAVEATWWSNDRRQEWLGERMLSIRPPTAIPTTSRRRWDWRSVHRGRDRPHSEVVAFQQVEDDDLRNDCWCRRRARVRRRDPGRLEKDGMRGVGEIDITRPRWSERPGTLVPTILLGHIENFEPAPQAALRARTTGGLEERAGATRAPERPAGRGAQRRRDQADDRSGSEPSPGTRVSERTARSAATRSTGSDRKKPSASCRATCFVRKEDIFFEVRRRSRTPCARTG